MKIFYKFIAALFALLIIAGAAIWWGGWGSISPTHPALASGKMAPIIPIRDFFANTAGKWAYRPSPKGQWLSWYEAVIGGRVAKYQKLDGSGDIVTLEIEQGGSYFWDYDDQHLLVAQRKNGRRGLWKIDANNPGNDWLEVTPRGFRNWRIIHRSQKPDGRWLISSSDRSAKFVDIYSVKPDGLGKRPVEQNPGNVTRYLAGSDGKITLRVRRESEGNFVLEYRKDIQTDDWQRVLNYTALDEFRVAVIPDGLGKNATDKKQIIATSNRNRDHIALVSVNIETGEETVIEESQANSIRHWYLLPQWSDNVDIVNIGFGYPEYRAITENGKKLLKVLEGIKKPFEFNIIGRTIDGSKITLAISEQENSWQYMMVDVKNGTSRKLGKFDFTRHAEYLAETKFEKIKARDGLEVPVLLTLPYGVKAKNLPMIVHVHGGPASNTSWRYSHRKQFFANRGYAVLSVNYRGSAGFGRKFQEAGFHQYGRAMQDDIIDAAKWAIGEGIADKDKIAIYGGSFGGYSAMMGVARDPDFYAAGISVVGATDLQYQTVNAPHFWGLGLAYWTQYFGSAKNADDLKEMREHSPVNHISKIKVPVLLAHGINDHIVDRAQSESFEREMKRQGKDFEAYYYEKEGHGFRRWQTKIMFYRKLEDFLARHLGGRSGGFDYTEIGAKIFN